MPTPFTLTVTNAGRAAIVNAARDGTNAVRIASVGVSAAAAAITPATAALPGEIKRITTIAGDAVVAADTIHVTVRDETNALYTVRSIALYLADGTLFAGYGQSDVLVEKSAQAMLLLALDVRFTDIAATNITFGDAAFLNPPATTETAGVAELATDLETSAGTDDRRTVTPKGLSFALTARFAAWGSDIWRASNDGAGSGIDADLLDGRDGSYYADIAGRLGYTPVRQGTGAGQLGNTIHIGWSGTRLKAAVGTSDLGNIVFDSQIGDVWRASNDGAGSGLDADLLDGQDSSFYTNIIARLGYTPANKAGTDFDGPISGLTPNYATTGGIRLRGNPVSGVAYFQITDANITAEWGVFQFTPGYRCRWIGTFEATGEFSRSGARVWDAANDGSGSGLDADLLDGRHASDFTLRSEHSAAANSNGLWERRPSGVIEQWGTVEGPFGEGLVQFSFPIPFSNPATVKVVPVGVNYNANNRFDIIIQRVSISTSNCVLMVQYTAASTSINQIDAIDWHAIGF